ncbi:MAG: GNAT family N-acetyltransferase [Mycobacteriales bacterium]|jgi:uncharacterized protein
MSTAPELTVTHLPAEHRFEAHLAGDQVGVLDYVEVSERTIVYLSTRVPAEYEGRGIGSALARAALDDARARGRAVVPRCWFVEGWIDRHPEYADLVSRDG